MFRHDDLEILLSICSTINDIFVHPKFWSFEEFTVLDNVCYLAKNVWDMFANAIMVTHQKNHITYVCMYVQSRHSGSDYLEKAYQFQTTVYISIYVN